MGDEKDDKQAAGLSAERARQIILARRARFVAAALAGIGNASCDFGGPQICLSLQGPPEDTGTGSPDAGPSVCLSPQAPDAGPRVCLDLPFMDAGPQVCLEPPHPCFEPEPRPPHCYPQDAAVDSGADAGSDSGLPDAGSGPQVCLSLPYFPPEQKEPEGGGAAS